MSDKIKHCCQLMTKFVADPRVDVEYLEYSRGYYVDMGPEADEFILYCPFCGSKLPENLHKKWLEVLKKEYGLDDPLSDEQKDKITEEFNSDEWWRKRGL